MSTGSTPVSEADIPSAVEVRETSGDIECYHLKENGMRVLLLPQNGAPVATSMVTYHVGSRNERTGHTGATHMLEHLMFKGTERFHQRKGTSIFETLQRVGAKVNASTWMDRTNYFEMLPTQHLPLALEIEADRMRGALIDPEDVEDERTVILNERDRNQNDPVSRLFDEVWGAAFVAHPYHHPTIGWKSDIENLTPEGLREYYDTFYWPNNATLSLVGHFVRADVLAEVVEHFGSIDAAPHEIPELSTEEPEQTGQRRVTVRQDGELGAVLMSYKSPPALHEDSDVLDVLARILASGKGSRLYRRCTDQGLTSDVFGMNFRLRDPGLFSVFGFLAPDQGHETVESAIEETIEQVQKEGVTREELDRARSQLRAQIAFDRDGPMRVASQLNEALAAGDWRLYTQYLDRLEEITADDVQQAARRYLTEDASTIGWYVPTG